ncbi:hypothetical protein PoB_001778700 [Plakobranchus ocellatus]|uniref:MiT/TFE transcription factors N-terminal domain-containing protein n=1 Tax=Plakobranchus ocellatus TaxID=259542 RepID=A0AAV3Z9S3_9GAST|nr:hypothetical protein PoB_001778700 [Plakobranchus ocellatus]
MTSLMFQAMGIDAPPLPPKMPSSLRRHLYTQERMQQQRLLQQQRQLVAYREAQRQRDRKLNPYSESLHSEEPLQYIPPGVVQSTRHQEIWVKVTV